MPCYLTKLIRNLFSGNIYMKQLYVLLFVSANTIPQKTVIILYFCSFTSQIIFTLLISVSGFTPVKINSIDPRAIDLYPNYIWVYLQNHYIPQWIFVMIIIIFYSGNSNLHQYNNRQYEVFVNYVKELLNS